MPVFHIDHSHEPYDGEGRKDYRLVFLWFALMGAIALYAVYHGMTLTCPST